MKKLLILCLMNLTLLAPTASFAAESIYIALLNGQELMQLAVSAVMEVRRECRRASDSTSCEDAFLPAAVQDVVEMFDAEKEWGISQDVAQDKVSKLGETLLKTARKHELESADRTKREVDVTKRMNALSADDKKELDAWIAEQPKGSLQNATDLLKWPGWPKTNQ